jgi:DNA-directed RNA polymerase sigma subunit (sigma70/sigma32)
MEPWEIPETCALDVADRGDASLEEVGLLMNLSKSGVEKIINKALAVLRRRLHIDELREVL